MTAPVMSPDDVTDPDLHANGNVRSLWRWMREYAPVHKHPAGELPAFWSITRYDDIRMVYRDPSTFSSAHGVLLRPITEQSISSVGESLGLAAALKQR